MNQLESLSYFILPGHNSAVNQCRGVSSEWMPLYNQFFETWKSAWRQTFVELGSEGKVENNDFLRQSVLSGLVFNNEFIALQTNTFLDLRWEAHRTHPYFGLFPDSFFEEMTERNLHKVMTIEYLYAAPSWRKAFQEISLGEVLSCLALHLMAHTDRDAMIAMPRADRKVNEMIYSRGAEPILQDIELHNVKIDLVRFTRKSMKSKPDTEVDHLIHHFWNSRMDLSEITTDREDMVKTEESNEAEPGFSLGRGL